MYNEKTTRKILSNMLVGINNWMNTAQDHIDDWNVNLVNDDLQFASEDIYTMDSINNGFNYNNNHTIVPTFDKVINKLDDFLLYKVRGVKLFTGSDDENKAKAQKIVDKTRNIITNNAPKDIKMVVKM